MSSMVKQPTKKKKAAPKRTGTAFWLADQDGDLVRAIAAAEDRTIQMVIRRAIAAYAENSPEYQASKRRAR